MTTIEAPTGSAATGSRVDPDDYDDPETPPWVVGAVAAGVAPLPFLAVYAVLFIVHGSFHPVSPPDITRTKDGELAAGIIAAAIFLVMALAAFWFYNGRRRWLFALAQLASLGTAIDFVVDDTKGGRLVSVIIVLTSVAALVLAFSPQGWEHVRRRIPKFVRTVYRAPAPPAENLTPDLPLG